MNQYRITLCPYDEQVDTCKLTRKNIEARRGSLLSQVDGNCVLIDVSAESEHDARGIAAMSLAKWILNSVV